MIGSRLIERTFMQRLSGDFTVKRIVTAYSEQRGGVIVELYELPNGQWQFGRGRDATTVKSMDEVEEFDPATKEAVSKWLDRIKALPSPPEAVIQGDKPASLSVESSRAQLDRLMGKLPDSVIDRLLSSITQTIEPMADSLTQAYPANSHSGGFGDASTVPPGAVPFMLPEGATWADPSRPESGYFTVDREHTEKVRMPDGSIADVPAKQWHPTPQFETFTRQAPDGTDVSSIESQMDREREQFHADHDEDAVGVGSGRGVRASSRRAPSRSRR